MKNKLILLFATIFVVAFAILASMQLADANTRVHQHQTAEPKKACSHSDNTFCTHLPLVTIDTGGQPMPGKERDGITIVANIRILDSNNSNNHLSDQATVESKANIRYRGHSSMSFDKKGYRVEFVDSDGQNLDVSVMGMNKHHQWALHGPFLDKTLIRNYMWYNISGEIMDYAPNVRFCELFLDGEYQGLYLAVETIDRSDEGRLQLAQYKEGDPFTSYILRLDKGNRNQMKNLNNLTKYARRVGTTLEIEIVYPAGKYLTPELVSYINNDFSQFEKALYSYDYDDKQLGYKSYISERSFVDYYIINEFTQNYDAGNLSTYLAKDLRGKISLVVWDFNSACDNYKETIDIQRLEFQYNLWYFMLMKDEHFTEAIINRYKLLRKSYLSEEYLLNYIDETIEYLGPAIERNFQVWGYTFSPDDYAPLRPQERNPQSYQEAVDQLKKFIVERGDWLDQYIVTIRQFSHESKVKKFNH